VEDVADKGEAVRVGGQADAADQRALPQRRPHRRRHQRRRRQQRQPDRGHVQV